MNRRLIKNASNPNHPMAVAAILAGALAVVPLTTPDVDAQERRTTQMAPAVTVTAGQLADEPSRYLGERVQIDATVEDVYSRSWFTLDEDRLWSTGEDVLVLNPRPGDRVTADRDVTVVGQVQLFSASAIERQFDDWNWDLDRDRIVEFSNRPVVIAESIRESRSGADLVQPDREDVVDSRYEYDRNPRAPIQVPSDRVAQATVVTAGELADHPDRYYGRLVKVQAEIEDRHTRTVFALDEDRFWSDGEDVIVVAPNLAHPVEDDMQVTVTGEVVRFNESEIERRTDGYTLDVLPELRDDFDSRPVILATSVRTADGRELVDVRDQR